MHNEYRKKTHESWDKGIITGDKILYRYQIYLLHSVIRLAQNWNETRQLP